jgi:hypothetical protein
MPTSASSLTRNARIGLLVILAVYGFVLLRDPSAFRLIDNVDLAIHEAGHVFFGPFGEFIGFLGGTLMQLIVPLTFMGYFIYKRDLYATSVLLCSGGWGRISGTSRYTSKTRALWSCHSSAEGCTTGELSWGSWAIYRETRRSDKRCMGWVYCVIWCRLVGVW